MERVGIIGIGLVGTALAERLLEAGYSVAGYDVCRPSGMRLPGLAANLSATPRRWSRRAAASF